MIVASTNANYADWAGLSKEDYEAGKRDLIENTLAAIEKYVPDIRGRLDYVEAATPLTFERYTKHLDGASFGTKFEGLAVSRALPEQIAGLYHAGSVGIIMSGWLGAVNYGVIVANDVDAFLMKGSGIGIRRMRDGHFKCMRTDMNRQEILDAIPHRDPFLLVDEILERTDTRIVGSKTFSGEEWFFAGHYPGHPLVPGVLLCEAAMQCGAILLSRHFAAERRQGARGHAHERRPFQTHGSARREDRHGSGTDRATGRRLFPQGQSHGRRQGGGAVRVRLHGGRTVM